VVTGASGGVGSLAVALLAGRGFTVAASSGKRRAHEWLRGLGASSVLDRAALAEPSPKPLLKPSWQGGVDTVGGQTLATLLKSLYWGGAVAACGLVGGTELNTSVYPFILRGARLLGIDSAACPMARRSAAWAKLAGEWRPADLEAMTEEIGLDGLEAAIQRILKGEAQGRVLVDLDA
jgi:putative YhdH/YhfP family quinone oxidoreductase